MGNLRSRELSVPSPPTVYSCVVADSICFVDGSEMSILEAMPGELEVGTAFERSLSEMNYAIHFPYKEIIYRERKGNVILRNVETNNSTVLIEGKKIDFMPPALWGKNYVLAFCLLPFPVPESRAQLYPGTKEDLMGIITGGKQEFLRAVRYEISPDREYALFAYNVEPRKLLSLKEADDVSSTVGGCGTLSEDVPCSVSPDCHV
ncbi:hypothetical protein ACRRTK_016017 [Alexandromys fortis]